MEADPPSLQSTSDSRTKAVISQEDVASKVNCPEENDIDSTIHAFNNISNITVIERPPCEGSDSGVEVLEGSSFKRTLSVNSANSQDLCGVQSCDSSISYCSNYDDAYNLLVRRNSTLLDDYTLRNGDRTSENGSESSSITGSSSSRNSKRNSLVNKRKLGVVEAKNRPSLAKDRSRCTKPPVTPKSQINLKSTPSSTKTSCARSNKVPPSLDINKDKRPSSARASSATRTPLSTPTDDGRWPSVHSKPAPLMSKSLRGILETPPVKKPQSNDTKTIEKYATLPRRRKEKSADEIKLASDRDSSMQRSLTLKRPPKEVKSTKSAKEAKPKDVKPPKDLKLATKEVKLRPTQSPLLRRKKIKIYQESCNQTALTMTDVEKALAGITFTPTNPSARELRHQDVQVDLSLSEVDRLKKELKLLTDKYDSLHSDYVIQTDKLKKTEEKLKEESFEKEILKLELKSNSERVLEILGGDNTQAVEDSSDSLIVLETRFQNVSQIVLSQEQEISKLNANCRSLQLELDKSLRNQNNLIQQQKELEAESIELQEFMQAEKSTLMEAMRDFESEIKKYNVMLAEKNKQLSEKQEECKHLVRLSEQRKQECLGLLAKLGNLEATSRELLVHQGSSVSGAAVALTALISRLDSLVGELVSSYSISEQELEDVIFHNEVYSNSSSSPDATPEKAKKFSSEATTPNGKGSSFVSAVINAIKNAAAQTPFSSHRDVPRNNISREHSSSNEMLDSETEPCLMMEHVLEDVIIPDGHTHNMISSGHSMLGSCLAHSESLKDLTQAILNREKSEQANSLSASFTSQMSASSDYYSSSSLVDQVIEVDNLITKLLKVIRIIQMESEDCMNELQDQREHLADQVDKQKETNKIVARQLRDWEVLGARLKTEIKELLQQIRKKDNEMENLRCELSKQREQVERQTQDVCELSTALSKIEFDVKVKEEEAAEALKNWENSGKVPSNEILERLLAAQHENSTLKEKIVEKEKHLSELNQECLASRQVLTENVKEALNEAKKQYDAIDHALEVLHGIQSVVQQCPPLAKLQRELEDINFQSASAMPLIVPPDFNANAGHIQAINGLEISPPINTTA